MDFNNSRWKGGRSCALRENFMNPLTTTRCTDNSSCALWTSWKFDYHPQPMKKCDVMYWPVMFYDQWFFAEQRIVLIMCLPATRTAWRVLSIRQMYSKDIIWSENIYRSHLICSWDGQNAGLCIFLLQNGSLWNMGLEHCAICATRLLCCHTLNSVSVTVSVYTPTKISVYFQEAKVNPSPLDKMTAISQTIFSDAFSWTKSFIFWLNFYSSVFLRVQLTITHHWLRWWLGAE